MTEVGVPVDVHQSPAAADPRGEARADHEAAVPAEHQRRLTGFAEHSRVGR